MICLANSFPIDPPAPIIQTDLPFIPGPNKEFMGLIDFLLRRLSIDIGLNVSIFALPFFISSIEGI